MPLAVPRELIDRVLLEARLRFPGLSEAEIKKRIRTNNVVFMHLVGGSRNPSSAFETLNRAVERGQKPEELLHSVLNPYFDLIATFRGSVGFPYKMLAERFKARRLPAWFVEELAEYLDDDNHADFLKDLSFWLTKKLLTNGRFMHAIDLTRQRWGIGSSEDPRLWFRKMNDWQEDALQFCEVNGVSVQALENTNTYSKNYQDRSTVALSLRLSRDSSRVLVYGGRHAGEVRFETPFDHREVTTYDDVLPGVLDFGLPILDYESDLAALTWLAGAKPGHSVWRQWIELILWDFREVPWDNFTQADRTDHWAFTGRNVRSTEAGLRKTAQGWYESAGRVRIVPNSEATMSSATSGERPNEPGIVFHSRWVNVNDYPARFRSELVHSLIETWGTYEPLPGAQNIRSNLRSLLRPFRREEIPPPDEELLDEDAFDRALDEQERGVLAARKRCSRLG